LWCDCGFDCGWVEVECLWVDVGEDWCCFFVDGVVGWCDEWVGWCDYFVVGFDVGEVYVEMEISSFGWDYSVMWCVDGICE